MTRGQRQAALAEQRRMKAAHERGRKARQRHEQQTTTRHARADRRAAAKRGGVRQDGHAGGAVIEAVATLIPGAARAMPKG
jgi:hypothetical protein